MSAPGRAQPWLSPTIAVVLVLVSAFSLLAFMVLSAYAPDLQTESDGGGHALSDSAVGFAGIVQLLRDDGVPVVIDRGFLSHDRDNGSLIVLTPDVFTDPTKVAAIKPGGMRLIVLPKWVVGPDPLVRGWVRELTIFDEDSVVRAALKDVAPKSKVIRRNGVSPVILKEVGEDADFDIPSRIGSVDSLQVISGEDWIPLITDGKGGILLALRKNSHTYVLSDPDLMNTHGLRDLATARTAVGILQGLRENDAAVLFDVTLNGYGRSPSLLRAVFAPPFLGATLCAIFAAALMAWHAMGRFGAPQRALRALAAGKEALVDNSAQLIRMMGREPHMTFRYAQTTRNIAARAVGLPRSVSASDADAILDRLTHADSGAPALTDLLSQAARTQTKMEMMDVATKLYFWRRGLTRER